MVNKDDHYSSGLLLVSLMWYGVNQCTSRLQCLLNERSWHNANRCCLHSWLGCTTSTGITALRRTRRIPLTSSFILQKHFRGSTLSFLLN